MPVVPNLGLPIPNPAKPRLLSGPELYRLYQSCPYPGGPAFNELLQREFCRVNGLPEPKHV